MIHSFDRDLTWQSQQMQLPPNAVQTLNKQRANLAAVEFPPEIDLVTRHKMKLAVNEAFVRGFRDVMLIGCGLAAGSAFVAFFLIRGNVQPEPPG
jgi:hypothetical protein